MGIELGICTMTKNQGSRLIEWVKYHNNLGFNKFIIFLDNCNDDSKKILESISDIDIDIYETETFQIDTSGLEWIERSHVLYTFTLSEYENLDWIGFIEVDEFIFPQSEDFNLVNFLMSSTTNCLYINSWDFKAPFDENKKILGQSNLVWTDEQRYNSDYRFRGKSIIKTSEFNKCIDAHHFQQKNGYVSEQFKIPHTDFTQKNYGNEVIIDDSLIRIYHFRNHTPETMNQYKHIDY